MADAKDLATIIGVVIAVAALAKGILEYTRNAVQARVERFAKLRQEFFDDPRIAKITELLETDDPKLADVSARDKWRFLGFFEQVALLLRAHLTTDQLAYYMFGYYATLCDRSRWFWGSAFPKDEAYWLLFLDFVRRMKVVEDSKRADPSKFVAKIRV